MPLCYPVNLVLEGLDCLVVGGGETAERKVLSLLEAGARVRVVTIEATESLVALAGTGQIELSLRKAREGDLAGAFVVIIATNDGGLNRRLAERARAAGQLVNVVDVPELCSFYVPGSVRRGPLLFTVGSDGEAPALTKCLRQEIEAHFGPEYGELAEMLGAMRDEVKARYATQPQRKAVWEKVLSSQALALLRAGKRAEAQTLVEALVRED